MWRQVILKEKRNVIKFDLKNVSAKKHKETKKACISFKSIIFVKKMFWLYFSPIARSFFFNKVAGLSLRLWHRCFPVNLANFLRTLFLQNTCGRLLLTILKYNLPWDRKYIPQGPQLARSIIWPWVAGIVCSFVVFLDRGILHLYRMFYVT